MPLEVLFEDPCLLAVNKPSGLLVHPLEEGLAPRAMREETCLSLARNACGMHVHPVHRLDRATSGLLLFAKSPEIATALCRQMECHDVTKEYVALARGWMKEPITVSHPVWNEIRTRRLEATTQLSPREWFEIPVPLGPHPSSRYTFLAAHPRSGRYHQIRQHLKHLFHPIVGDTAHGDGRHNLLFRERFSFQRLFLHATALSFMHPATGERMTVRASLPDELKNLLETLRQQTKITTPCSVVHR